MPLSEVNYKPIEFTYTELTGFR